MTYVAMASALMVDIAMACISVADIIMTSIAIAYIVMACKIWPIVMASLGTNLGTNIDIPILLWTA